MTDAAARALQFAAVHGSPDEQEQAWEQLYALFRPMMFKLVPMWVPEDDREDWMAELHEHMMRGVRLDEQRPGNKFTTFVFGCMQMAQQHLVEKHNTFKRAMARPEGSCYACGGTGVAKKAINKPCSPKLCSPCGGAGLIVGSTSLQAPVGNGSDSDAGMLADFLMDSRAVDAEQWAAFTEFLTDVDNALEPAQVPVWRWLIDMGGDVNAVARWLHLPVREVRETLSAVRKYVQGTRMLGDPLSHRFEPV